jgi:hypothetical protein
VRAYDADIRISTEGVFKEVSELGVAVWDVAAVSIGSPLVFGEDARPLPLLVGELVDDFPQG